MNMAQKIVLTLGALAVAAMTLYPPLTDRSHLNTWYGYIFSPGQVDLNRWLIQFLAAAFIVGVFCWLLGNRRVATA